MKVEWVSKSNVLYQITQKLISCVKEIRAASNYYLFIKPLEKLGLIQSWCFL